VAGSLFSYVDLEKRVRTDHPLRVIRGIVNATLAELSGRFDPLYSPYLVEPHTDRPQKIALGGYKGFDTEDFVAELREINVTPRLERNTNGRRSAIDGRATHHPGYAVSLRIRKRIEEAFGCGRPPLTTDHVALG
jgi:hypothetical protein